MCGIFGIIPKKSEMFNRIPPVIKTLYELSESRGKDASGIALKDSRSIRVLKRSWPARKLVQSGAFQKLVGAVPAKAYIGHARMETNGPFTIPHNNQPVIKDGIVTIHNGIITNDGELWKKHSGLKRRYEVDTEILNSLLRENLNQGLNLPESASKAFGELEGSYSIASFFEDFDVLLIGTNTGSMYLMEDGHAFVFASERYFLKKACKTRPELFDHDPQVRQMIPAGLLIISLADFQKFESTLPMAPSGDVPDWIKGPHPARARVIEIDPQKTPEKTETHIQVLNTQNYDKAEKLVLNHYEKIQPVINNLRRCSRCILPDTMPFIEFDENGVCNYCRGYTKQELKGRPALENLTVKYRSNKHSPDCIVAFSGGRDSSYGIHYLKKELGLTPVTFTYDWGMITDLARRNIARMCGKLGVENILISADIQKKRANIRKNVKAWLAKPDLGTVPIFMAGDKQFFYYVNKIKRETGIKMDIWMGNRREDTKFKVGFCGIAPKFSQNRIDYLSMQNRLKLAFYYARQYLSNPAYINASIFDTIWAYFSYYVEPRTDYYLLYDYIKWEENIIEDTLINHYNWETSPESTSTWRIGDGTAPFYNYIYYTMAGFTENDTFRSCQIREGEITRESALQQTQQDNRPKCGSISWYCNTVDIDMIKVIESINSAPKKYRIV